MRTYGAYQKAKSKYFTEAYNKLHSDFNDGINAIIKSMNDSLSKEQKEAQKNR